MNAVLRKTVSSRPLVCVHLCGGRALVLHTPRARGERPAGLRDVVPLHPPNSNDNNIIVVIIIWQ